MIGTRWRLPMRIAWRTARRYPGRTALVGALVGLPVFAASFVDTLAHTAARRPATEATREFGAADGVVVITDRVRYSPYFTGEDEPASRDPATVDLPALLPAGTRLVGYWGNRGVRFDAGGRTVLADGAELRTDDPVTTGMVTLRSGALPRRPGEIALSPRLAQRLGVRPGDEVHLRQQPGALRVVGLATAGCRSCQAAFGLPGWIGAGGADPPQRFGYLIDLPGDAVADQALAERLGAAGVELRSRDEVLHPDRWGHQGGTANLSETLPLAVLIVGLGLIEVVLLAGTAFAVTARRRVREFALVLATGGRPADARRLVLTHGVVLGLIGSAGAALLGIGAVFAGLPLWQRLADRDFDGLAVGLPDLAAVVALGVLTSLAAAAVPARGAARVPVLAGLAGRYTRPTRHRGRRTVAVAAAMLGTGLAAAIVGALRWHAADAPNPARVGPANTVPFALLMTVGFGLAIAGMTVAAPALVGLVGRVAGRLPLSGRLAVRDAARHRHRTGPAVAAAMVAVTGSVAVLFVVASFDRHDRTQYQPSGPPGSVSVYAVGGTTDADLLAGARQAAVELPGAAVVPVRNIATTAGGQINVDPTGPPPADCDHDVPEIGTVAAGADLGAVLAGPQQAAARAALASGRAAVFNSCLLSGGRLLLTSGTGRPIAVPAVVVTRTPAYSTLPAVVLDDRSIRRLGLVTSTSYVLITTSRPPTAAEEDRARGAVDDTVSLAVERGFGSPYLLGILALVGIAGLITLAGVMISVTLSAAEGQADLATLAAIGATPGRRRAMAAWQAALVAGLGTLPGVALGTAISATVRLAVTGYPAVLPWAGLLAVGVAVPAVGVLLVAATTRARLPMVRRLA